MRRTKMCTGRGPSTLLATLALLAAACGGGGSDTTLAAEAAAAPSTTVATTTTTVAPSTTTAAPTTTTAAPTTTTTAAAPTTTTVTPAAEARDLEDVIGGDLQVAGWLVESGAYMATRLEASPVFSIEDPVAFVDYPGIVTFGRRNVSESQLDIVVFVEPVGVIPAAEVGTHPPHDPPVPVNTQPLPASLDDWLEAAPQVAVVESGEVEVAGEAARWWEFDVDPAAGETFDCGSGRTGCVAFIVDGSGPFVIWDNAHFRVWQLGGAGDGLWGFMQSAPSRYEDTLALAEELLAGMTFPAE